MLRRAVVVTLLAAAAFVASPVGMATAGFAATGVGAGRAAAQTVSAAATPTASATGQDVTVSWTATTLSGGTPVTGYIVRRYNGALVQQTILAGCASVTTNGCIENTVPGGTWTYSVQATRGNWLGAESARSNAVTVTTAIFTITANQKVKAAATVTGGALTGYAANDTITFRLDSTSGTVLTGSISSVSAAGSASGFTVTIPAGTSQGNHTTVAIGGSGAVATSNTFLFDSVAPTNTLSLNTPVGAYLNGLNLYFKSNAAGSFKIVDTVADAGSGPASATFPTFTATNWTAAGGSVSTPSGGPYTSGTYSWIATGATPGGAAATRTVTGFDAATNSAGSVLTFLSDTTQPPAMLTTDVILAPVGNTTTKGFIGQGKQYYVYAKPVADTGSGIGTVTANVNTITTGQTAVPMVAGTYVVAGVTYTWRTAAVTATTPHAAGSFNITVSATDNVGNGPRVSPNSSVTVDNTNPTGSITVPTNGGFATASTTVTSNSADPATNISGVYSAEFQYSPAGAGSWTSIAIDTATPFTVTWNTTSLTDGGSYDLRLITTDNASNTFTSATVTVTIDRTAPTAPSTPVLAPASDGGVQGDNRTNVATPTMTGTAEADSTVTLYDGVTQVGTATATGGNWTITASTLTAGAHTITATATDAAGNVSTSSGNVVVTIDTTQPSVTGVVIANGPNLAGQVDAGDTGTVTFSEQMDATTFCSIWTNSGTQTLTNVTVTIADGADTLTVATASCTMALGLWFVGDYVDGNATFTNSTVSWNPTTFKISVTLGTLNTFTTLKTGVLAAVNEYTGSAPRADLAGNAIVTTKFTAPAPSGF